MLRNLCRRLSAICRSTALDSWPDNFFQIYPALKPQKSSPAKPLDPLRAPYLYADDKRKTVHNRESFIKHIIQNINERTAFLKANNFGPYSWIPSNVAPLMGVFGSPGSGKTYSLGHLMKVVKDAHDPLRMEETKKYLINCLGDENGGLNAFDTLSEYIVIPITLNSHQTFDEDIEKDYASIILSRVISSLSDETISHKDIYPVISSLRGSGCLTNHTYELLDAIYNREGKPFKYIFVLDDLMMINNEGLRTTVLNNFCSLMKERGSTVVIATSLDASVFLEATSPWTRNVHILPLDPVPSLVLSLDEYRSMLENCPSIAAILFDRMSDPSWLIDKETDMIDLCRQNLPFWKLFKDAHPLKSNVRNCLTQATIENLSNILLSGDSIGLREKLGEYKESGRVESLTASRCLHDNILTKFKISAYKEGAWLAETVEECISLRRFGCEFVPASNIRTFHEILIKHPNVIKGLHCAAYWALCMTLVNPWIDRFGKVTGEGFEIFDAFNEILHRMGAYHDSDYFACADPTNVTSATFECNHMYKRLPFIAHSSYCVAYMEDEVNLKDIITGMEVINDPVTAEADTSDILYRHNSHFAHFRVDKIDHKKSSLEQATKDQLDLFRKGGVLLFNIPKGCGYDYAIADKNILSFFKCTSSKAIEATAHSRNDSTKFDLMNDYKKCASIFENLNGKLESDRKFTSFRLIVKAYRELDPEDIPKFENLHVFGPEDCSALYPQTFRNMVEMAMLGSPKEAFEALANMMKKH